VVEIITDKVVMELAAPAAGVLSEIVASEGSEVTPGAVLGRIKPAEWPTELPTELNEESVAIAAVAVAVAVESKPRACLVKEGAATATELSPAVKKLLREHNLEPSGIVGTGREGRITYDDVMRIVAERQAVKSVPISDIPHHYIPHSVVRKSIAHHMTESLLKTAPHVTAVFDCDLSWILKDCAEKKAEFAQRGVKLTLTAYFLKAAAHAITAVPEVNSRWYDDRLEVFDTSHIGVATATDAGLVVPVIRDVQRLSLFEVAAQLGELTHRARSGTLTPRDVSGGTFTITNHGMGGSLIATPIIHQPQSAILGIGKAEKRVCVRSESGRDEIEIRPMCYLTLTIDHRVLDGFRANAFLTAYVAALQGPP
jgi:2-oxoglutarate dehydrogenase E2 component (dihydrolipoamide succinyltransferase)